MPNESGLLLARVKCTSDDVRGGKHLPFRKPEEEDELSAVIAAGKLQRGSAMLTESKTPRYSRNFTL